MTMEESLVHIQELLQLSDIGVDRKHCTWTRISLSSDEHICIRHRTASTENNPEEDEILILKLKTESTEESQIVVKQKADFAAVCPPDKSSNEKSYKLAYQIGDILKVIKLNEKQEQLVAYNVTGIKYLTWISPQIIAIITQSTAFHLTIHDTVANDPKPMFEVDPSLADAEIISYKSDADQQWLALTGLVPEANMVSAVTQLHCCQKDLSQCIVGHAACFAHLTTESGTVCPVFCTACRDVETENMGKVHVIPLGCSNSEGVPSAQTGLLTFPEDNISYDFPVSLQVCPSSRLLYILTKYGLLFVCDLMSGQCLCTSRVSHHVVFTSVFNTDTQALLAVNRAGQVLQMQLKSQELSCHVDGKLHKPDLAKRLSTTIFPDLLDL